VEDTLVVVVVVVVTVVALALGGFAGAWLAAAAARRRARDGRAREGDERAALTDAVTQLVRMNEQVLAGERRRGTQELDGTRTLIDRQVAELRAELIRLTGVVQEVERERREQAGRLDGQLREAGVRTQALTETTQSLRQALSSTSARGQWGERMAEDVLRLAGLVDGINYRRHQAIAATGRVPDFTFFLPDGALLHMDVKFPFDNYLRHLDARSDVERERTRKDFLKDVRARIREVTARDYVDPAGHTVDCVLLFIANEQVYGFIQEHDRTLVDDALRAQVVLCSPLTLFAVLAVVRRAVDNFRLSQTSQEILALLQGFEKQWGAFVAQMDKVGRSLKTAGAAFDELEGTRRRGLERQLEHVDAVRRRPEVSGGGAGQESRLTLPGDAGGTVTPLAREA